MKSTKNPSFSGWNPIEKPPAAHFMGPMGAQAAEQAAADPEGAAAADAAVRGSQGYQWENCWVKLGHFHFFCDVKMY